jgi:hypothetical protein
MPFEVYTGAQPGRPRRLLIVTAALLAGSLGLAWVQVQSAGGLAGEQRVGEAPLYVRVPRGWHVDPRNPHRFRLPVGDRSRKALFEFERQIEFDFLRLPTFQPLEALLQQPELARPGQITSVGPARLGPYAAVEVRRIEPRRVGRLRYARETAALVACLPRGQVIHLLYEPVADLRPTDMAILTEIAASLRVEDDSVTAAAAEYLRRAGLSLAVDDEWVVVGPHFAETPGVFIGGPISGVPGWSIAVFRTWLAGDRTPADLLVDLAAEHWLVWAAAEDLETRRRADGATIVSLRHPQFPQADTLLPAAYVVAQAPDRVAILLVFAGAKESTAAAEAARLVAEELEIKALPTFVDAAAAEAVGQGLVADLRKAGPVARWGREAIETKYQRVGHDEVVVVGRGAVQRDPQRGYEGQLVRRRGRGQEEWVSWKMDANAGAYTWQAGFVQGITQVRVLERRGAGDGEVERQVQLDDRRQKTWRFTPGAAFVAPPVDSIIKGWVAQRPAAVALVETSTQVGPGTHTVLVRQLAADGEHRRVLVQEDFWPIGGIEAYDDDRGETVYEQYPSTEYRRIE